MNSGGNTNMEKSLNLRVGDWVEVKTADEILATLDGDQSVSRLPFMPEMLEYCGKRFRVKWSAHKTSDTIELFEIRRLSNAVHLADLRCNGAAHGGCQAGCLIFWKECWLKRVPGPVNHVAVTNKIEDQPAEQPNRRALDLGKLSEATTQPVKEGEPKRYRCQATEMLRATTEVRRRHRWDPRFYIRDLTSGNVSLVEFVRFGALAVLNSFLIRWFKWRIPRVRGLAGEKTPSCDLNLQPGDLVRVRSKREIMQTLGSNLRNRGLWFDVEMVPFCNNGEYEVLRRVETIINEKTGEMIRLKNPCIILRGVTCGGNYSRYRMFSRRHEYHFWREIWLTRVTPHEQSTGDLTVPSVMA